MAKSRVKCLKDLNLRYILEINAWRRRTRAESPGAEVLLLRERNTLLRFAWDVLLDTESVKHCIQATARRFCRDGDAVYGIEARERRSASGKAWQRLILG